VKGCHRKNRNENRGQSIDELIVVGEISTTTAGGQTATTRKIGTLRSASGLEWWECRATDCEP